MAAHGFAHGSRRLNERGVADTGFYDYWAAGATSCVVTKAASAFS